MIHSDTLNNAGMAQTFSDILNNAEMVQTFSDALHNSGIIPTLNAFNSGLAETALSHNLPITASLQEDALTLKIEHGTLSPIPKAESGPLTMTLLHNIEQLDKDAVLAAIDEALCGELNTFAPAHPQIKWIPVGRFTAQQLAEYMKLPYVCAVCDLSFMDMGREKWEPKCLELRSIALGYSFAHMGIHNEEASGCLSVVNTLQSAFGFPSFDIGSSVMVSAAFEITKANPQGVCGHIAIETASVVRAISDLQAKGFSVDESTIQYQPGGRMQSVYLNIRLGGFSVHLVQKR